MKKNASSQNQTPIQQEILRALRYHRPLSLLAVSAEPASAPSLLSSNTKFAEGLRRHLRNTDMVAEESDMQALLVLPETPITGAIVVGNRLIGDLLLKSGAFHDLTVGISAIDEGVYRAEDLIQTANLANRAGKAAGLPLFTIATFRDKSLSLSTLVAIALTLSGEESRNLSSLYERTRHEPEGLRESASRLIQKIAAKLKIPEELQEILSFWILFHDIPQLSMEHPSPDQKVPHLSRRKKALQSLILSYAPSKEAPDTLDPAVRTLLEIVRAVLGEIGAYHNPTEEIFADLLGKVLTRFETGGSDKKILAALRKTQPAEWFSYPT